MNNYTKRICPHADYKVCYVPQNGESIVVAAASPLDAAYLLVKRGFENRTISVSTGSKEWIISVDELVTHFPEFEPVLTLRRRQEAGIVRPKEVKTTDDKLESNYVWRAVAKYAVPPIAGIVLLVLYVLLFNRPTDTLLAAILVLVPVRYLFRIIPGPPIPNEELNRVFNFLVGQTSRPRDSNFDIGEYFKQIKKKKNQPSVVAYYSKSKLTLSLVILFLLGVFAFVYFYYDDFWAVGPLMAFGLVFLIWDHVAKLTSRCPLMVLTEEGVAIKNMGFTQWNDVKHVRYSDSSSCENTYVRLQFFFTEADDFVLPDFSIATDSLNLSIAELSDAFEKYYGKIPPWK